MGIAGSGWRFEHGPPTLAQIAGRLSARCGLPVTLRESSTTSGTLTIATLRSRIDAVFWEDDALELELAQNESQFVWTHLEAALTDLGGKQSADRVTAATSSPPAWTTRPWSQIGAWRRFTLRRRALIQLALLPVNVALVPFWTVYDGIRDRRAGRLDAEDDHDPRTERRIAFGMAVLLLVPLAVVRPTAPVFAATAATLLLVFAGMLRLFGLRSVLEVALFVLLLSGITSSVLFLREHAAARTQAQAPAPSQGPTARPE